MKGREEVGREETTSKGEGGGEVQSTSNTMNIATGHKLVYTVLAFFCFVSLSVGSIDTGRPYSDNFGCHPG